MPGSDRAKQIIQGAKGLLEQDVNEPNGWNLFVRDLIYRV